jgi:hypothetical protein
MIRRVTALVLVLALYTLIAALLAEGAVRLFRLAPPAETPGYFWQTGHPITGWTLQPDIEGRWFNPMYEYDQMVRINSRGLRSPPVCLPTEEPCDVEDVFRILVLGDSYIEALHVPLDATFGQQIGRWLMGARLAAGRQVEVVNVGVSGWGTDQQLLWLREEGPRYAPDLIVLAFYPGNDFMNNHMALEYANFGGVRKPWFALENGALALHDFPYDGEAARASIPQFEARRGEILPPTPAAEVQPSPRNSPLPGWLHEVSALYRYVEPRIRVAAPGFAANLARWGVLTPGQETSDQEMGAGYIPVTYGVYRAEPEAVWEEAFAVTGALFHALRAEADTLNADLAAVLLTAPEQVHPDRWEAQVARYPAMQAHEWTLERPTQVALELLAEAGIPALNLLPLFREAAADGAALHFRDDGHWTQTGHAFAGALAANFLAVQGLTMPETPTIVPVTIPSSRPHLLVWLLWIVLGIIVLSIAWGAYQTGPRAWLRGAGAGLSTTVELFVFTLRRGQYVLLPLLVVLILFGGLLLIAQSSVVGPFIYPLF